MKARPPDGIWRLVLQLARLGVALAAGSTGCLTAEPVTAHLPTYHDCSLGFRCCGVAT